MFKVGDLVRVVSGRYFITTPGSEGVVFQKHNDEQVWVHFTKVTGKKPIYYDTVKWIINICDLKLFQPKSKEELVLDKIYTLYKKNKHTAHWERKVDDTRTCAS